MERIRILKSSKTKKPIKEKVTEIDNKRKLAQEKMDKMKQYNRRYGKYESSKKIQNETKPQ